MKRAPGRVQDLWPLSLEEMLQFKMHFAVYSKDASIPEPLEAWLSGGDEEWRKWQEHRTKNDEFKRPYIFSLMRFGERERKLWLFGGIFKVLGEVYHPKRRYSVRLVGPGEPLGSSGKLIGRLIAYSPHTCRNPRLKMEKYYGGLRIRERLSKRYSG